VLALLPRPDKIAAGPIAMKPVGGAVGVSNDYQTQERYPQIKKIPSSTTPALAFERDLEIAAEIALQVPGGLLESRGYKISFV